MCNARQSSIARSAEPLALLLGPLRGLPEMVDHEALLLVQRIALLLGPDRVRRAIDSAVDSQLTELGTVNR